VVARTTRVFALVADALGVTPGLILSPERHRSTSHARKVVLYVLRHAYSMSYPELGRAVGFADHTSAMTAVKTIEVKMRLDLPLRDLCDRLVGEARRWQTDGAEIAQLAQVIPYRLAAPKVAGGGHG
jgi:chromosomal replication initiation ATPase DnaA